MLPRMLTLARVLGVMEAKALLGGLRFHLIVSDKRHVAWPEQPDEGHEVR